ncbi:MAG: hypothetical protein J5J06_13435 [Phycisphaerae bacterium]|nr:hypothetical protein [Phycisphaerae bacterium]
MLEREGHLFMLAEIEWNTATLSVVLGCLIPITGIVAVAWYRITRVTSENAMKQRMVERGMTADEIERVINATSLTDQH